LNNIRALYGLFFFTWDITAIADITSYWIYILVVSFWSNTGIAVRQSYTGVGPAEATT